jgi:signal transduction histidine kinase
MDRRPSPTAVVLLAPRELAASLGGDAGFPSDVEGVPITLLSATADLRDELPAARGGRREVAILYVAADEETALLALEVGADEALDVASVTPTLLARALRRAVTRASTRLQAERVYGSAAHAEKLRSLGALVAGVAHEVNNPCAALLLSIEVVRRRLAPLFDLARDAPTPSAYRAGLEVILRRAETQRVMPDMSNVLDDMARATDSISSIVRDLRIFTRSEEIEQPQRVDVHALLDQVLRIAGSRISARGHVERDYAPNLPPVFVPRSRLAQVFTNILVNAAQAIGEIDRPVHRVRISTRADDEGVVVTVSDTGPGISPEHLERIFDPFFTTKKAGEGTGLGLALSNDLMRRMGGHILAESDASGGATFLVYLPSAAPALDDDDRPADRWVPAPPPRRRVILAVEDDERVLRAYARVLRDHYDVLLASDGQEAIDLLRSGSRADAVLTDLILPEVDGHELIAWLRAERPELAKRIIVATASPLDEAEDRGLRDHCAVLLEKPVSHDVLLRAFDRVLGPLDDAL